MSKFFATGDRASRRTALQPMSHRSGEGAGPGGASVMPAGHGISLGDAAAGSMPAVQAKGGLPGEEIHRIAAAGTQGAGQPLPYLDSIQRSFGFNHDLSGIRAHVGGDAAAASSQLGAEAYAMGDQVAFAGAPSLHTAAHEAAHVLQQRRGIHLKGGVGRQGDVYERHADAVADRVAAGNSAQDLLPSSEPGADATSAVQLDADGEQGTTLLDRLGAFIASFGRAGNGGRSGLDGLGSPLSSFGF